MISTDRFCLNRKAAPGIALADTIPAVAKLGLKHIEVRNDLYGAPDNASILDHMTGDAVKQLLTANDVHIETINAVGNMDNRQMIDENLASLTEMLEMTKGLDLGKIIFCPVRSTEDHRSAEQRRTDAVANVRDYAKLLKQYHVDGLIEPLGFTDSTLRTPWEGQAVIEQAGVDNFKLVADTFHYYLANVTAQQFHDQVDVNAIGLVHLSAVFGDKPREALDDQDRYMLAENDVMHSADWAKRYEAAGYKGLYAFEPFSDDLKAWDLAQVKQELLKSIQLVQN